MDDMDADGIAAAMGFSSFGGTKKRKYDQTSSPKAKADASGANTTLLGVRSKAKADTAQQVSDNTNIPDSSSHSAEVDTETMRKQPTATGLAAFLSRGQHLPERPAATEQEHAVASPSRTDSSSSWMISFGGPAIPQAELAALRNGVPDENGDKTYFLPSFVEDPWEIPSRGSR